MGGSYISIDGGPYVPLESLTPEEKAAAWERIAKRIGETITDYVKQHPEEYERTRKALLDAGGRVIKVERY